MDRIEQYSLLCDTFHFTTHKVEALEVEYLALMEEIQDAVDDDSTRLRFRENIYTTITDLETFYVKQIKAVEDILAFQEKEKYSNILDGISICDEMLKDLRNITVGLLRAHQDGAKDIMELLS